MININLKLNNIIISIKLMNIIRTRFPPEPNGYLHMGHIKSMYYNFGYPFNDYTNKECYLRFDDTNPKTETLEYENQIRNDVKWMGYKPDKITYTLIIAI